MGIFKKKSPNRIGNGLTYVEADTVNNKIRFVINGAVGPEWEESL